VYARLVSYWWRSPLVIDAGDVELADGTRLPPAADTLHSMMLRDSVTYLPDDILVKVDRASMSTSLEVHVPLLDHRVFEFAWRLPATLKVRDGRRKWLLRQLLARHVPVALVERPKMGFSIPLADWLRGPLRDWAEGLLAPARLREQGYLAPELVRQRWSEHQSGRRNWQHEIWNVLMFQAWLAENA
jgi:asparagine synthase (glutamine-hydrolysing)